jgi:hypothetical protein
LWLVEPLQLQQLLVVLTTDGLLLCGIELHGSHLSLVLLLQFLGAMNML